MDELAAILDKIRVKYLPKLAVPAGQKPQILNDMKQKMMKKANFQNFENIKLIIEHFCASLDEKLNFILQNIKVMKSEPQQSQSIIEQIQSDFEVEDNLPILVLQTIFSKIILGDSFSMQKEFMMEIEELSNVHSLSVDQASWIFAKAKSLIVETMLAK